MDILFISIGLGSLIISGILLFMGKNQKLENIISSMEKDLEDLKQKVEAKLKDEEKKL